MQTFNFPNTNKQVVLALGAESAGNFSVFDKNKIYFSQNFGDLLIENNFKNFQKTVLNFLKKEKIKPTVVISDLHPLMKTTLWGKKLAKKFKAEHIQVQHHHAHIFSTIGDNLIQNNKKLLPRTVDCEPRTIFGIALDGTGYGPDEKIWGGEVFQLKIKNEKLKIIERIGSLENQILIGGELAIQEPARMLIAILAKVQSPKSEVRNKSQIQNSKNQINFVYNFVKKYYSRNEFELLYNQLEQNFNCVETSSTGRILDAASLLLGFCKNERIYKHAPIDLLERNSTTPYKNLKTKIIKIKATNYELQTTPLFKYLIENLDKDKKRLAATAQLYLAQGLHEIIKMSSIISHQSLNTQQLFASGGITNNKIISKYFQSKNIYLNNIVPRGDAGLSFGQITYFLLNSIKKSRARY